MMWCQISVRQIKSRVLPLCTLLLLTEALIADNYTWFLPTYKGYHFDIQRVDAARYFILHEFGKNIPSDNRESFFFKP